MKCTSLIEMAFHSLDPHNKGYVTTSDLQKLSADGSASPTDVNSSCDK
jgi:Ca2+-binding EF-hand superfamily protein